VKAKSAGTELPAYVDERLARALSNPVRVKIIDTLSKRTMSVSQFVRALPEYSHSQAYRHFRWLEAEGFLEVVDRKTGGERRGATEYFYRANVRSLFDQEAWARLPDALKNKVTGTTFSTYINRVAGAIEAGTIDTRPDRHFTWSDPVFDQQAWDETIDEVEALFNRIPVRSKEAAKRLAQTDEEPIPVTIALACFESPKPKEP
jgi:DNA-binding transcriptional ArsR family regulator